MRRIEPAALPVKQTALMVASFCLFRSANPVSNGKKMVKTDAAPGALGPYSQAIVAGGMVYCAGQIPLDPATGQIVSGDVAPQTEQVLKNLRAVLKAAGSDLDRAVKNTVFLKDLND